MTEEDWLTSTDPQAMLNFLQSSSRVSERKLRLFAVACCRRIWGFLLDNRSREAVEVSERYADGLAPREQLVRADRAAGDAARVLGHAPACAAAWIADVGDPSLETSEAAARAAGPPGIPLWDIKGTTEFRAERSAQADLLRDIFGNPFWPPALDPTWLTWNDGLVQQLAQAAYEERSLPDGLLDRARLAVLADALTDVGCNDADLLDHLRGAGPHVRGCGAIDILTGWERGTP
jgi:hypothetical protein